MPNAPTISIAFCTAQSKNANKNLKNEKTETISNKKMLKVLRRSKINLTFAVGNSRQQQQRLHSFSHVL